MDYRNGLPRRVLLRYLIGAASTRPDDPIHRVHPSEWVSHFDSMVKQTDSTKQKYERDKYVLSKSDY